MIGARSGSLRVPRPKPRSPSGGSYPGGGYTSKRLAFREAQKAGARTLREIAETLNARGIATARGGQWYAQSVANVLARASIGSLSGQS
jgi:hypothetical protein